MGYYFENEPQNIHNTKKKLFIYYSHSDPMGTNGQTDKRTDKRTNGQMDKRTDGQIFAHYSGITSHSLRGVRIGIIVKNKNIQALLLTKQLI